MKRTLVAAGAALAIGGASFAAGAACPPTAGDCEALLETGPPGGRVDFAIVGDGYTAAERDLFYQDAASLVATLSAAGTYGDYAPAFNVWALFVPSAESGADDPATSTMVDTAFDATFGAFGVDYLVVVNDGAVFSEIVGRLPEFDVPICVVNASKYGGSGGPVAVVTTNVDAPDILLHELGHTFGGLTDEYEWPYPGYPPGDPEPNAALLENLSPLKWQAWVTPGTAIPTPDSAIVGDLDPIGAFEGARYLETGIFRPAPICLMRELDKDFCPVCSEAMVLGFSELSSLVDDVTPGEGAAIPAVGATEFTLAAPALADLSFTWAVDGAPLPATGLSASVDPSALGLADGPHQIVVVAEDETPLVRVDPDGLMSETFTRQFVVDSTLPPVGSGAGGSGGAPPAPPPPAPPSESDETDDDGCGCATGDTESSRAWLAVVAVVLSIGRRRSGRRGA